MIYLSTKNFSEASKINGSDEFKFIIGSKALYCHKFLAAFLSHKIEQMIISDSTTSSFQFQICPKVIQDVISEDKQQSKKCEEIITRNLQKLLLGENIEITKEELQQLSEIDISNSNKLKEFTSTTIYSILQIIEILDNDEICQKLYKIIFEFIVCGNTENQSKNNSITKEKIESKLNKLICIEKVLNLFHIFQADSVTNFNNKEKIIQEYLHQDYDKFIKEIAHNFSIIDDQIICKLNDSIINDILTSSDLQVDNEDSLLSTLIKRRSYILQSQFKNSYDLNFIFKYIQFEFLSEKGIQIFLNEIHFEDIDQLIWNNIIKRLVLPVKNNSVNTHRYSKNAIEYPYNSERPLDGIFKHLTDISKGNIQTNKTIEMSCSRLCCYKLETIVDSNNSSEYTHIDRSQNVAWLKIDFKKYKVLLKSYLIKVRDNSCIRFLRSWRIDISNDGEKWETIDERNDVSELNGQNNMKLFNVEKCNNPFRFMRIFTDKVNWNNQNDGFTIGNLELFGNLIE